MGRVDVSEDIGFEGCVHYDDTESAYHFGAVAYFGGTEYDPVLEEVEVVEDFGFHVVAECERA